MEWISEKDKYKFVFKRINSMINLQISDYIGILIETIKFNQFDAMRILGCLHRFNNEVLGCGDSFTIQLNYSLELNGLIYYIYIENILNNEYDDEEIYNTIFPKDINIQIKQFNEKMIYPYRDIVRLSTLISSNELTQLCNTLYSATLMDVNNPSQCKSIMRHSNKLRE